TQILTVKRHRIAFVYDPTFHNLPGESSAPLAFNFSDICRLLDSGMVESSQPVNPICSQVASKHGTCSIECLIEEAPVPDTRDVGLLMRLGCCLRLCPRGILLLTLLLLSGYVQCGRLSEAKGGEHIEEKKLRKEMGLKGVRKVPGCSWIHLGGGVHIFLFGDKLNPQAAEIMPERIGSRSGVVYWTSLLAKYSRSGFVDEARVLFEGYVQCGRLSEAKGGEHIEEQKLRKEMCEEGFWMLFDTLVEEFISFCPEIS
ncbi:hypothetical protein Tsubulata_049488, partial [Turnera subulata]